AGHIWGGWPASQRLPGHVWLCRWGSVAWCWPTGTQSRGAARCLLLASSVLRTMDRFSERVDQGASFCSPGTRPCSGESVGATRTWVGGSPRSLANPGYGNGGGLSGRPVGGLAGCTAVSVGERIGLERRCCSSVIMSWTPKRVVIERNRQAGTLP